MSDAPTTDRDIHPDAKHEPQSSGHTDPAPEYEHKGGREKPVVDTNVTGEPIVRSPDAVTPDTPERPVKTSHERAATAESTMTNEAKARIAKNEADKVKDAKRVSKVLKEEGRADTKLLKTAIKELERLQKVHKQASKDEASALSSHSKAIKTEHKLNMRFLAARAKHEAALADLKAKDEALIATKEHVKGQAVVLREKETEVETMREKKALDDREREAKLRQLTMSPA